MLGLKRGSRNYLGPFPYHASSFSICPASILNSHCCLPKPHAPLYHRSAHVSRCAFTTISMAAPGPEWMLWAKRLRDEHANLVHSLEALSSTVAKAPSPVQITNLEASQLALQQEVKSLRDSLAIAEQQREKHTRIADERNAALEAQARAEAQLRDQKDKVTNEQIRRLEKWMAALSRRAPSASKLGEKFAETIRTSPLSSKYI